MPIVSTLTATEADQGPAPNADPAGGEIVNLTMFPGDPDEASERSQARPAMTVAATAPMPSIVSRGRALVQPSGEPRRVDSSRASVALSATSTDRGVSSGALESVTTAGWTWQSSRYPRPRTVLMRSSAPPRPRRISMRHWTSESSVTATSAHTASINSCLLIKRPALVTR
jgi:hypothetical protein